MGPLGWPETVFIVILALLLFGPKKLPELGRTLGKAITEFRKASAELRSTFDREMRNLERETEGLKETTKSHFQDSYNYDYSSYDTGTPYPEAAAAIQAAPIGISSEYHQTESASATEGAGSTSAEDRPALTVIPATGTIANGSLEPTHVNSSAPGALAASDPHPASEDTVKS